MSLSNDKVNKLLRDEFVCAYVNTKDDPNSGESFSHSPRDPIGPSLRGNGEHNVQMITMTPAGEIFHVLSGFVGPEELLAELQFARETWQAVAKIEKPEAKRKKIVVAAHEKFAQELESRRFDGDQAMAPLGDAFRKMQKQFQPAFVPGMQNMMAGFTGQRAALDHAYVVKNPLLPYQEYRSEDLVGEAKSFFGSVGVGTETGPDPRARAKSSEPKRTRKSRDSKKPGRATAEPQS